MSSTMLNPAIFDNHSGKRPAASGFGVFDRQGNGALHELVVHNSLIRQGLRFLSQADPGIYGRSGDPLTNKGYHGVP